MERYTSAQQHCLSLRIRSYRVVLGALEDHRRERLKDGAHHPHPIAVRVAVNGAGGVDLVLQPLEAHAELFAVVLCSWNRIRETKE